MLRLGQTWSKTVGVLGVGGEPEPRVQIGRLWTMETETSRANCCNRDNLAMMGGEKRPDRTRRGTAETDMSRWNMAVIIQSTQWHAKPCKQISVLDRAQ